MAFFIWSVCFFLEMMILFIWSQIILRGEFDNLKILFKDIKVFYKCCLWNIRNWFEINSKSNTNANYNNSEDVEYKIRDIINELKIYIILGIAALLLLPLVIAIFITMSSNYIMKLLIICAFIVLFVQTLISNTKLIIIIIRGIRSFISSNYEEIQVFLSQKKIKREKRWILNQKNIVKISIFLTLYFLWIVWVIYELYNKKYFTATILGGSSFIYLIINNIKNRIKEKQLKSILRNKEINIWGDNITEFSNEILQMCHKIGIDDLDFIEIDHPMYTPFSVMDIQEYELDRPAIYVPLGFISFLRENEKRIDYQETVKIILAHEIIHIFYKDAGGINKNIRTYALLQLLGWGGIIFLLFQGVLLPGVIWIVFSLLTSKTLQDERYWGQIKELRADKKGILLSKTSVENFINYNMLIHDEIGTVMKNRMDEKNFFYKLYKKNIETVCHPNIHRRIEFAQRNARWGISDYLYLFIAIKSDTMRGRGWNG